MYIINAVLHMLLAVLAVFGGYVLLRLPILPGNQTERIGVAVEIGADVSAGELALLLVLAKQRAAVCGGRVMVLADDSLRFNKMLREQPELQGVICYWIRREL